jgi:phage/plasmid primase-like uncharacterized protein
MMAYWYLCRYNLKLLVNEDLLHSMKRTADSHSREFLVDLVYLTCTQYSQHHPVDGDRTVILFSDGNGGEYIPFICRGDPEQLRDVEHAISQYLVLVTARAMDRTVSNNAKHVTCNEIISESLRKI